MNDITAVRMAQIFKALCDPHRIAILKLLQTGEKCACNIASELDLAQSKLSYHMKILCDSGIVESWYVGKWTHYQISKQGSQTALLVLKNLTTVSDEVSCSLCGN